VGWGWGGGCHSAPTTRPFRCTVGRLPAVLPTRLLCWSPIHGRPDHMGPAKAHAARLGRGGSCACVTGWGGTTWACPLGGCKHTATDSWRGDASWPVAHWVPPPGLTTPTHPGCTQVTHSHAPTPYLLLYLVGRGRRALLNGCACLLAASQAGAVGMCVCMAWGLVAVRLVWCVAGVCIPGMTYTNVLWALGSVEACTGVGRGGAAWRDAAMVGVSVCVCSQLGGCCCWRVVQCSCVAKRRLGRPSGGGSCTWVASRGSRHASSAGGAGGGLVQHQPWAQPCSSGASIFRLVGSSHTWLIPRCRLASSIQSSPAHTRLCHATKQGSPLPPLPFTHAAAGCTAQQSTSVQVG
jgi:hypothetical protein